MKTRLVITTGMILIIGFFFTPVNAGIPDHKPVICFDCHTNGRFAYEQGNDDYCSCHKYTDNTNKLNQQLLETQHNPNTCKTCHGIKDVPSYHNVHANESCKTCHGDTGAAKPDKIFSDCGGCHGGQLHEIHNNNLARICSDCHGSRPASDPVSEPSLSTNELTAGIYKKVVNYRQYTLYEIFRRIFSSFGI